MMVKDRVGRSDRELLGGQHVMGRLHVQTRIRDADGELLSGEDVVRRFDVQARIGRAHPELLGGQHIVRCLLAALRAPGTRGLAISPFGHESIFPDRVRTCELRAGRALGP